jgi:uncharacterized protein YjbI with pentapeptide repeats
LQTCLWPDSRALRCRNAWRACIANLDSGYHKTRAWKCLPNPICKQPHTKRGVSGKIATHELYARQKREGRQHAVIVNMRYGAKKISEILEAHAKFVKGDSSGKRADFSGANLSGANLHGANLAYALLRGANLEKADLSEARLGNADFSSAKMKRADLRRADLTETNLAGADLTEAQLGGVECFRADLSGAILRGASLRVANLRFTNIRGADLRGADMTSALLRETNLDGVDLSGIDLSTTLMPRDWKGPAETKK